MTALQADIEQRLAAGEPDVEVLLAEVVGGRQLRVFIDHPDGVTLQLCERVSACLSDLRERCSLEVSSPGARRPLTKPAHYRRFVGRRARVRMRGGRARADRGECGAQGDRGDHGERGAQGDRGEHRVRGEQGPPRANFTGELIGASDRDVTLAAADGIVTIPYSEIRRCNLVED